MSYPPPTDPQQPPPYWQRPAGQQESYPAVGPGVQRRSGAVSSNRSRLMFILGGLAALMILGCIGLIALGIIVGDGKGPGGKELTTAESARSTAPGARAESSAGIPSTAVTTAPAATVPKPKSTTNAPVVQEATEAPVEPKLSVEQRNAIESAESYLESSSFSRTGLIKQLNFEGYPVKVATKAVDSLGINFKEQAAKSAASYLDSSSFSRTGLVKQLEFEGFTHEQAVYGVNQVM